MSSSQDPSRRDVLAGIAAVSASGCGVAEGPEDEVVGFPEEPGRYEPEGVEDRDVFPCGIQVGDPTPDSAIVSVQTSAEAIDLELVVAGGDGWTVIDAPKSLAVVDGFVQVLLSGLDPDQAYTVLARSGEARSRSTRFRTALADGASRPIRIAATACLGGSDIPWPSLSQAAVSETVDMVMLLGDTVYIDGTPIDGFVDFWLEKMQTQGLYDLTSMAGIVATWDDHEVDNNWTPEDPGIDDRVDAALDVFRRMIPQGNGPQGALWRSLRWGEALEIFVLDGRGERFGDDYLGREQMDWLKEGLVNSTASIKLLMNSVPFADISDLVGEYQAEDRWQGWPEARAELLDHIVDHGIEGVLSIAGDFHHGAVWRVDPAGGAGERIWEVLAGPGGSFINPMATLAATTERYALWVDQWNTTIIELYPATMEFRVRYIGDDGAEIANEMFSLR